MDTSNKLTILFFLYFLITGLVILLRPKKIQQAIDDIFSSSGQILLVGFISLTFGASIISFHGYYGPKWPIVITLIGWLGVIKGVMYLLMPELFRTMQSRINMDRYLRISGVFLILLSFFFAYHLQEFRRLTL